MPVIAANGAELSYTLQGPTGTPVVAFSNSLGTTRAMWNEVVPHLRGRYRLLTYDTRGHGGSKTVKSEFGVGDLAADLAALLGALHIDKAHIVGLSLGGMTAQALAAAHPDRVLSLTLMATSAYMPSAASWGERAALVRNKGTKAIVDATIARWFTPGFPSVSLRWSIPSGRISSASTPKATRCVARRSARWICARGLPKSPRRRW